MSEPVSPLQGATFKGYVTVTEAGLRGMITLRADLSAAKVQAAVKEVAGVDLPGRLECVMEGGRGAAWMSPDELLLMVPYGEAEAAAEALSKSLGKTHHLSVNVSDARSVFTLEGKAVREVLAKLAPVDLSPDAFPPAQFRRTRLAQVPAAFWLKDDKTAELIAFRSVAGYVFDLLKAAAKPGSEVGAL